MQNSPPKSFYIASKLENAPAVRALAERFKAAGWRHTYDWTVHGSVRSEGAARIEEVASNESVGVFDADVLIVLLPGGRGTHSELGMMIGKNDLATFLILTGRLKGTPPGRDIYILGTDEDFNPTGGSTCAFYYHPYVRRFTDLDVLVDTVLKGTP